MRQNTLILKTVVGGKKQTTKVTVPTHDEKAFLPP